MRCEAKLDQLGDNDSNHTEADKTVLSFASNNKDLQSVQILIVTKNALLAI